MTSWTLFPYEGERQKIFYSAICSVYSESGLSVGDFATQT